MNTPTPDDVLTGVKTRLLAEAGWTAAVPGGVWFSRRPEQAAYPYAVVVIEERDPTNHQSNGTYTQDFGVEVSVWVASTDTAAADTATPAALLQKALGWVAGDPTNGVAVANASSVIHVRPAGGSLKMTEELKAGQDIMAAGRRVEICIEGKRG